MAVTTPKSTLGDSLRTRAFIDGAFVDAASGRTYAVENPATGEVIAEVAEGGAADVDRAVAAARRAAPGWAATPPADRKKLLIRFADLIDAHAEELARIETLDVGKPITDTRSLDIPDSAATIRWHAEATDKLYDEVAPTGPGAVAMVVREPLGVVAAIVPWNYPLQMAAWKLGPILATGNAVVMKPAQVTSLSLLRAAELAAEAGIPDGVLNVVTGPGSVVGTALARHPDVDGIAFTGSTEVGRTVLEHAAQTNLKRVALELGGKSPQIVLADAADLDRIAERVASAIFWNMGENCSAGSRLIVDRRVKEALLDRLVAIVERDWIVGDPMDEATRIGPLITKTHMDKVLGYIEAGKAEGARAVVGGGRVREDSGGWFVAPTIFDRATNRMRIAREEIFGPVLSVIEVDGEEEAIATANDTDYGLAASIYTENVRTAHRVARAVKAGVIGVNAYSEGDLTTPFGGFRQSGFGGHDKSLHAHDQYTELKTIWIDMTEG
ncbi:MAG TPA: aldehyde dehydrogenase [Candidatus Limnocylindrales bacterium]|nr:aldehyde dehydrogenase [Candidatus Limnocylindrales bacterium]